MNVEQILADHAQWLKDSSTGKRADLKGVNLRLADLRKVNLSGADLSGAHLCGANLCGADLRGANLSKADLREACLIGADLSRVTLLKANLIGANFSGAALNGAYLLKAILAKDTVCTGKFHHISNVGSEKGTLELYQTEDSWFVKRGCFEGTVEQFLAAVQHKHGDNEHGVLYRSIIQAFTGVSQ